MLNRQLPPPFVRSTSFTLIEPITITSQNGLVVKFISGGAQNVIHIEFIFNAGRWYEDKTGISHFTSTLLSKGTAGKTSFEIAQLFDSYGSHFEVSPGLDVVSVSLYALVKNIKPVLDLFLEVIIEPIFPEKELAQSKSIFLQNLKINNEKTSFQASKAIRRNLFGNEHAYGKELDENDVTALERHELTAFHRQFFSNANIIVSGKVSDDTQQLILDVITHFPVKNIHTEKQQIILPDTKPTYLEKEGSLQSSIRLGKLSLQRTHPDYVDVLFLNHILGGYFGSRLMKNIREEKGLTYGIYSSIHALQHSSYEVIGADVNKENRTLAIAEIKNEIQKLRLEPIGVDELDTARYHFIGSLQTEMTTPFAHAEKIKSMMLYALPEGYYQNMINRIDSVTALQLFPVAQKYFNEELYTEVSVG